MALTLSDVAAAAERLRDIAHRTPVHTSRTLDALAGCQIFLKCENFQRVGAFKFRGAYNAISQLSPSRRRPASSPTQRNHAQVWRSPRSFSACRAMIVMPDDALAVKREAFPPGMGRIVAPRRPNER